MQHRGDHYQRHRPGDPYPSNIFVTGPPPRQGHRHSQERHPPFPDDIDACSSGRRPEPGRGLRRRHRRHHQRDGDLRRRRRGPIAPGRRLGGSGSTISSSRSTTTSPTDAFPARPRPVRGDGPLDVQRHQPERHVEPVREGRRRSRHRDDRRRLVPELHLRHHPADRDHRAGRRPAGATTPRRSTSPPPSASRSPGSPAATSPSPAAPPAAPGRRRHRRSTIYNVAVTGMTTPATWSRPSPRAWRSTGRATRTWRRRRRQHGYLGRDPPDLLVLIVAGPPAHIDFTVTTPAPASPSLPDAANNIVMPVPIPSFTAAGPRPSCSPPPRTTSPPLRRSRS